MSHAEKSDVLKDLAPTGTLRAAMNYTNTVLVQRGTTEQNPKGVAPDLARALGERLGVPVTFVGFEGAGAVFEARELPTDDAKAWDIAFMAIEPVRAAGLVFTAPYVMIEGTYMVPANSPLQSVDDVDRAGHRIMVAAKSAYDLFLTRSLKHAELIRGDIGNTPLADLFQQQKLDAIGGVRQLLQLRAENNPQVRLMSGRFMEIRQAMATHKDRTAGHAYIKAFIDEMKASGFVEDALARSGQKATVPAAEG